MDERNNNKGWGVTEWILIGSIILMILFAIAYFVFDISVMFFPIILSFPFMGSFFRKKED